MDSTVKYWLWFTTRKGLSPQVAMALYEGYGKAIHRLYLAGEDSLCCYDLSPFVLSQLLDKDLSPIHEIMGLCDAQNIQIITYQDATYPNKLRNLIDPPLLLYAKGRIPLLDDVLTFAMVGARQATPYGVAEATEIALSLTKAGAYVITGMAEGIDSACIEGALKAGGPLVSVVAGGIDQHFPKSSSHFYHDVATVGVILSEYPPKTPHMGRHFRPRNRIISGLSNGVMLVESRGTGGSMMTASIAEEQGRDLFALPTSVRSPMGVGPHRLIQKHGAYLVTSAQDILEFYGRKYPLHKSQGLSQSSTQARVSEVVGNVPIAPHKEKKKKKAPKTTGEEIIHTQNTKSTETQSKTLSLAQQKGQFSDDQIKLLGLMQGDSYSIDALVEVSQLPAKRVLSAITMLEMDGMMTEESNGKFRALVMLES